MIFPRLYKEQLLQAIESIDAEQVSRAIEVLAEARDQGRRIFVCGNGEMIQGGSHERTPRFRMLSLSDSLPTVTANDIGYECIFVDQLKNFAEPGDVLIGICSSGNSPNVLRAVEYGNSMGCRTIALTGHGGGQLGPLAELEIRVAHHHTRRIEDLHLVVVDMMSCYFMEEERSHRTS